MTQVGNSEAFTTPKAVAAALGVTTQTVLNMVRDGRLPGVKAGGTRFMLDRAAIVRMVTEKFEQRLAAAEVVKE